MTCFVVSSVKHWNSVRHFNLRIKTFGAGTSCEFCSGALLRYCFVPWVNSLRVNSSILAVAVPALAAEVNRIGGSYCLILPKAELFCDYGVLFLVVFFPFFLSLSMWMVSMQASHSSRRCGSSLGDSSRGWKGAFAVPLFLWDCWQGVQSVGGPCGGSRLTAHLVPRRSLCTASREQQLLAGLTRAHVKRFNPDNSSFHSSLPPLSFPKKLELFAVFECQKGLLSLWELRQTCWGSWYVG